MTDTYAAPFADISAFVADANAINEATKTALNTAITNIYGLFSPSTGSSASHPDFNHISAAEAAAIKAELVALKAAITAHA